MKKVNVLFLDIDGVLNSPRHMALLHHEARCRGQHNRSEEFDPVAIRILNQVCNEFDVHIIVSSTWRGDPQIDTILRVAGLSVKFFDQMDITRDPEDKTWRPTPRLENETQREFHERMGTITTTQLSGLGGHPGKQIEDWFSKFGHFVDKWAIIDDDSDMLDKQLFHFVHTDSENGITAQNHRQLRNIFAGEEV